MGAPSESGGFFAWRFEDGKKSIPKPVFDSEVHKTTQKGISKNHWDKALERICDDLKKGILDVHVAIEAPLWGKKNKNDNWEPRFSFDLNIDKTMSEFEELPFYVSAGGATSMMAQQFLIDLYKKLPKSKCKINLYETYVSGLKRTSLKKNNNRTNQKNVSSLKKPVLPIGDSKLITTDHAHDSLEGLVMLYGYLNSGNISRFKGILNKDYFINFNKNIRLEKGYITTSKEKGFFGLGILGLGNIKLYNLERVILIHHRKYENERK